MDINESTGFNAANYIPKKVIFSHIREFFIYIMSISNRTRCRLNPSYALNIIGNYTDELALLFN